ncbi:division abnormally delayed protein isoform X1 [Diorhabda sublineata]|uniref:division abnormally delayed protein isoform X1 n=2 Tax=Diorhabda sublineata TaxID=1163346 RepID=UPI0024E10F5E|nr:division abnormally delayed protein isoform X1 [Diorhabda sublineata]
MRVIIICTTIILVFLCVVFGKNVDNIRYKRTIEESSCTHVGQFLNLKNITVTMVSTKGSKCGGQCCDDKTETLLRKQGQKDFADLLRHNSRSLQGLLTSTATTLQNHVFELARQSENKTLLLFQQVYRGMASLSRAPITQLYKDIRNYIWINTTEPKAVFNPEDIINSVNDFFTELFPLAYHHSADISGKDFTPRYKECVKKSMESVSPFAEIPKQIGSALSKSLEATRLLLQAFRIGSEVLNTTDTLLIDEHGGENSECHDALLKMTYCPRCLGLLKHTKPCSGYCLNVLRGCITKYVAELDLPWNGFVEGVESLVNAMKRSGTDADVNVNAVIKNLDNKISTAIMKYMEKGKDIDVKVRKICGSAEFSSKENPLLAETSTAAPTPMNGKPRSTNPTNFSPLPENELSHFLSAIAKTKGFYLNLANTLCQDPSFAERKDQQCWNGERIAEYTKTVVEVGFDNQKYNPEVKPNTNTQNIDPRVANLVDKLRRVHHMAISSVGPNYSESDMQRDGTEGSGSGAGPDIEDEEDEVRGSGSGDGPSTNDYIEGEQRNNLNNVNINNNQPTAGSKPPTTHDQPPIVHVVGGNGSRNSPTSLVILVIISWKCRLFM